MPDGNIIQTSSDTDMNTLSPTQSVVGEVLRIGLLINSFEVQKWMYDIVKDLIGLQYCKISLIIKNRAPAPQPETIPRLIKRNQRNLLFGLYTRLDYRLFRAIEDPFKPVDLFPLVEGIPILEVEPVMKKYSDVLQSEDLNKIKEHNLDLALRFGFRLLKGEILAIPRYGVWSFHHGDNRVNRGGPAGFWEVIDSVPITGAVLQIINEDLDNGRVIHRAYYKTHKRSYKLNRINIILKSAKSVVNKVEQLARLGSIALEDPNSNGNIRPYSKPLYKIPNNRQMAIGLLKLTSRYIRDKLMEPFERVQWFLSYKFNYKSTEPDQIFFRFRKILPPEDRFYADPFPVLHAGEYYIFFEEYVWKDNRGYISVIKLDEKGDPGSVQRVLELPYHISYPFVFKWHEEYFMIPETLASHRMDLYRCIEFPVRWELYRTLMDNIDAVDTTLFERDGRWWMFTSLDSGGGSFNDELYLFHAENPLGHWIPHPMNPVKTDVRSARCAGRLFELKGELYRPAQDYTIRYGGGMSINRVDILSTRQYKEEVVARIAPEWDRDLIGTHTFNHQQNLTVIDCLRRYWRLN